MVSEEVKRKRARIKKAERAIKERRNIPTETEEKDYEEIKQEVKEETKVLDKDYKEEKEEVFSEGFKNLIKATEEIVPRVRRSKYDYEEDEDLETYDSDSGSFPAIGAIGILIAVIVGVGVAIPVINEVISSNSSLSITSAYNGTAYGTLSIFSSVINFVPIFIALTLLIAVAGLIRRF